MRNVPVSVPDPVTGEPEIEKTLVGSASPTLETPPPPPPPEGERPEKFGHVVICVRLMTGVPVTAKTASVVAGPTFGIQTPPFGITGLAVVAVIDELPRL